MNRWSRSKSPYASSTADDDDCRMSRPSSQRLEGVEGVLEGGGGVQGVGVGVEGWDWSARARVSEP